MSNSVKLKSAPSVASDTSKGRWRLVSLSLLMAFQIVLNWAWLSTNVNVVGWDRPRHLIESLVYNDILKHISLDSVFEAWTYSGYYPPLFHMSIAGFYKLFGVSMDVAALINVVHVIILSVSAYGIGRVLGGARVGLLTAFVTATFPMVFAMSRYTYIEFSLTAMVALSIWLLLLSQGFSRRRYSLLFGISLGLGLLTKWTYALFVFPAMIVVGIRAGLLSGVRRQIRAFSLDRRWLAASAILGLTLTAVWYLPNAGRVTELPLNLLLFPISWLLVAGLIYLLRQVSHPLVNLVSGLWLGLVVAGSWYLTRVDFVRHTFLIAWGRPERHTWAFEYYLDRLVHEQLSPPYAVLFVIVGLVLLILARKRLRQPEFWRGVWRSDLFLLMLWIVVPYLVFSFRPSSRHSRFIMPILPAAAAIMGYGLSRIPFRTLRALGIAAVVVFGSVQWLVLSVDSLEWVRDAAVIELPVAGQVNIFANGPQNQLPSSGDTDSRFWIVPDVLDYLVTHSEGLEPTLLGLLVNTQQINEQHFQYLVYTDYPGRVHTREMALNLASEPVYPQLFEMDYLLLMTNHPRHRMNPDSMQVVETILNDPPVVFREAFHLVETYPLPDDSLVHLYERRYPLPSNWSLEASKALAQAILAQGGGDDAIIVFPEGLVNDLGPYYEGDASLLLLSEEALGSEGLLASSVAETLDRHSRVFTIAEALGTSTGTSPVVKLLGQEAYLTRRDSYGPAELTLYASPQGIDSLSTQQPSDVSLGENIALTGYSLSEQDLHPGEILRFTLFWQAQNPVDGKYRVFVYLLDSGGAVVGWTEGEPGGGSRPTTAWRASETVADNHGLFIPTYAVPGRYELVVGMYLVETGDRLPAYRANEEIGDQALVEEIRISP